MIGAIAGDIIGSIYEFDNNKTVVFPLFSAKSEYTDDTIMTIAVADWLLNKDNLVDVLQSYGRKYPNPMGGYGASFSTWLRKDNPMPYNSWGNGAAMRVSAVGWFFNSLPETLKAAMETAVVTHNHPEGIRGAQTIAAAIFLARTGKSKHEIKQYIEAEFLYDLKRSCDDIRPTYNFDDSCQGTVPEAIIAFLDSTDFENAIRLAVSLGGDSDTLACITGGIAEAFYGIPEQIKQETLSRLPTNMKDLIQSFNAIIAMSANIKKRLKYDFEFAQFLLPECNKDGSIKEFTPHKNNPKGLPLNKHGEGPFCRFHISEEWKEQSGVYAFYINDQIVYIGKCENLANRFNSGYGNISPGACFIKGQSTNCKLNNVVLKAVKDGQTVALYFYRTSNYSEIEKELIGGKNELIHNNKGVKTKKQTATVPKNKTHTNLSTKEIREYLREKILQEQLLGKKSIELRAGDIHSELNLRHCMPPVCNAMKTLGIDYQTIATPPKGNGPTIIPPVESTAYAFIRL